MLSNSSSSLIWPAHSISAPPFICLAGAFHQRAAVYLFGRRIPLAPRRFFDRPAMSRAASSVICRRIRRRPTDLVLLFGRRISSPRRILFCLAGAFAADPPIWCYFIWPAHSLPIHRFGVASFAGAFAPDPPIWCCFFCRRICCRSTDLVLLCLPAHSPPIHRFGVASFAGTFLAEPPPIWRCFTWPAHSLPVWSLRSAGASHRRAAITSIGRRIPSPRRHLFDRPAHPIAAPPSL
jgi:hypothetical protein